MKQIIFLSFLIFVSPINAYAVEFEWLKEVKTYNFFQIDNLPDKGWASNQGDKFCQSINRGQRAFTKTVSVPIAPTGSSSSIRTSLSYAEGIDVKYAGAFMANAGTGNPRCTIPGDQAFYHCSVDCPIGWSRTSEWAFSMPPTFSITFFNSSDCLDRVGWIVLCY